MRIYLAEEQGSESGNGIKGVLSSELPHVIYPLTPLASDKEKHLLEASQCARKG